MNELKKEKKELDELLKHPVKLSESFNKLIWHNIREDSSVLEGKFPDKYKRTNKPFYSIW